MPDHTSAHANLLALANASPAIQALLLGYRAPVIFCENNSNVVRLVNEITNNLNEQIKLLAEIKRLAQSEGVKESMNALAEGTMTAAEVWYKHQALDLPG